MERKFQSECVNTMGLNEKMTRIDERGAGRGVIYGPVIRIAPNELLFTEPEAWKDIYSPLPSGQPTGTQTVSPGLWSSSQSGGWGHGDR